MKVLVVHPKIYDKAGKKVPTGVVNIEDEAFAKHLLEKKLAKMPEEEKVLEVATKPKAAAKAK